MPSVLFVFTSANKTLTGAQTGWYLPEAAHPYYILAPYAKIDFASPAGPNPPIDDYSLRSYSKDEECVKFLNDATVKAKFANAKKLSDVSVKDYDAIFYVGGHGPVLDLASDPVNANWWQSFGKKERLSPPSAMAPLLLLKLWTRLASPSLPGGRPQHSLPQKKSKSRKSRIFHSCQRKR